MEPQLGQLIQPPNNWNENNKIAINSIENWNKKCELSLFEAYVYTLNYHFWYDNTRWSVLLIDQASIFPIPDL